MKSLYEKLGGKQAIDAAVDEFYRRILNDTLLAPVFESIDMARLRSHQRRFLAFALGGPGGYKGRDLGEAHRPIARKHGLNDRHFDAVLAHLDGSLASLGVASELREEALAIADSVRDPVLGRTPIST